MKETMAMLAGLVAGIFIGGYFTEKACEREAVKQDKAEFYLDENNNKQWRWK